MAEQGTGASSGFASFCSSTCGVWVFSHPSSRITHQIGTPFGRFFIRVEHLHFSRGWSTGFGARYTEREGLNTDICCEHVQGRARAACCPSVVPVSFCLILCLAMSLDTRLVLASTKSAGSLAGHQWKRSRKPEWKLVTFRYTPRQDQHVVSPPHSNIHQKTTMNCVSFLVLSVSAGFLFGAGIGDDASTCIFPWRLETGGLESEPTTHHSQTGPRRAVKKDTRGKRYLLIPWLGLSRTAIDLSMNTQMIMVGQGQAHPRPA